ncbi:MAG: hypothetical protein QM802_05105 [Agriterribacter sp.]
MTKTLGFTILFIFFTYFSYSQDELIFKVTYKPSTKYSQTIKQTSSTEVTYSGSEEFLNKLKEKGVQNPTLTKTASTTESEFNTGSLTDGIHFPVTMKFIKTTSSDGNTPIPDGTVMYGQGAVGSMPILDSIASTSLNEEYKKTLLQTINNMFSQISLPEKKLKTGEEFTKETPLSIPIAGMNIEMSISTTYKLLNIINGVGNFSITQAYTMTTTITKYPIKATGNGNGSLQYDIVNNNYIQYQIDTEMGIAVKLENFNLDLKSKSGFLQTTSVSHNE